MASVSARPAGSAVLKSYAQVVNNKTEHPTFKIPMHFPVDIDGEIGFVFSELKMTKAADEFRQGHTFVVCRVGEKMKNEGKVKDNKIWQQKGIKEPMEDKTGIAMGKKILETWAVNSNPDENMASVSAAHDLGDLNVTSRAEMDPEKNLGKVKETECGQHVQFVIPRDPDNSDEECEEVWHGDEPELQGSAQADRVQTTGLNEEENNDCLGNESPQGEVMTDYSSEREEGEIIILFGKKELYDTDGERRSTTAKVTKSDAYEENLVRKSLRFAKEVWNRPDEVQGMMKLATRLKRTMVALRARNKNIFGRVEGNIRALEERMNILEDKLQMEFSEELEEYFLATKIELDLWKKREASRPVTLRMT
ncbi:hypothetical protein ACLOJK_018194 [Asimina triloba]